MALLHVASPGSTRQHTGVATGAHLQAIAGRVTLFRGRPRKSMPVMVQSGLDAPRLCERCGSLITSMLGVLLYRHGSWSQAEGALPRRDAKSHLSSQTCGATISRYCRLATRVAPYEYSVEMDSSTGPIVVVYSTNRVSRLPTQQPYVRKLCYTVFDRITQSASWLMQYAFQRWDVTSPVQWMPNATQ